MRVNNATLTSQGVSIFGRKGGTVVVENQATLNMQAATVVGRDANSTSSFTVAASTVNHSGLGNLSIGYEANSIAKMTLTDAAVYSYTGSGDIILGYGNSGTGAKGTLEILSGSRLTTPGDVWLARANDTEGIVLVSGGDSKLTAGRVYVAGNPSGTRGRGILTVADGGHVESTDLLQVFGPDGVSEEGTLNIANGRITAGELVLRSGSELNVTALLLLGLGAMVLRRRLRG